MPLAQLHDRVAVVTGAGSGIGRAMVAHFVAQGMKVAAADIDGDAAAESAAIAGGEVTAHTVDVADADSVEALAAAVYEQWGAVHLLCNNAGVFQAGLSWQRSVKDWEWAFGVNLWGIIHGVKSFVPRMLDGGAEGHVVNTSSVAGFVAAPYSGPYNVSKVAAFSMSETLAHDLASVGAKIGASVLCPSSIRTGIAHTDKVRPGGPTEEGDDAAFVRESLFQITETGIDPADVPPIVLAGIAAGDFLIATKPSYANQIQTRFDALLERRLPPTPPVD
ncbi:MAG: NAD(P)-dependent dehydrogenase (short-subunit alcohol dehydrogenase family) [Candidatus Aldehydirespiratoraceae bacterium]|jgi:NAD(P)-dependent dehydrogenase (short-subunit alcohol dehydrogenase family)